MDIFLDDEIEGIEAVKEIQWIRTKHLIFLPTEKKFLISNSKPFSLKTKVR